jgi:uncharacterized protein (TIGR02391 family)
MTQQYKIPVPPFAPEQLEALARVLGDTSRGLTGSEIGQILGQCRIPDIDRENAKWRRLFNAFAEFQNQHRVGNHVVMFITRAMNPARYTSNPESFEYLRGALNPILALCGMNLRGDGKIARASKATTLDEALERSNRFQEQLRQRNVHEELYRHCGPEILAQNYFHAVLEAMKSITAKVRVLAGVTTDGHQLVDDAFSLGSVGRPIVAINSLETATQLGEQKGFVNLLKGLYGIIRNPLAHEPKIEWDMSEQDALDVMSVISLVHRKLDKAVQLRQG